MYNLFVTNFIHFSPRLGNINLDSNSIQSVGKICPIKICYYYYDYYYYHHYFHCYCI